MRQVAFSQSPGFRALVELALGLAFPKAVAARIARTMTLPARGCPLAHPVMSIVSPRSELGGPQRRRAALGNATAPARRLGKGLAALAGAIGALLLVLEVPHAGAQAVRPPPPAAPNQSLPAPAAPNQSLPAPAAPDGVLGDRGDACTRTSDARSGVVKQDACGRWYCGLTTVKDIFEQRPNIAAERGCTWRLEFSSIGSQCRCVMNDPQSKPK